ncbi:MAG TPA: hypothetical protein VJJ78_03125 [Candidatus Saccharimonadales bacterium]|nr:hypothetical protein [Candidatus Saccharimonadales bacterium]
MEPDSGESLNEKQKLVPAIFQHVAANFLQGTNMLQVLTEVNLATDSDGYIEPYVIDNVRTMLKVAAEKTTDEMAKIRFDNFRAYLAPY